MKINYSDHAEVIAAKMRVFYFKPTGLWLVFAQAFFIFIVAAIFSGNVYFDFYANNYQSIDFWVPIIITGLIISTLNAFMILFFNLRLKFLMDTNCNIKEVYTYLIIGSILLIVKLSLLIVIF